MPVIIYEHAYLHYCICLKLGLLMIPSDLNTCPTYTWQTWIQFCI